MSYEVEIVEGKWRCEVCSRENRGSQMVCQGCGKTRGNEKFYLDDNNAPVITDKKVIEKALAGPDWVCNYCDTSNAFRVKVCKQCGASKDGVHKRVYEEKQTRRTSLDKNNGSHPYQYNLVDNIVNNLGIVKKNGIIGTIVMALMFVLFCGALFYSCNFRTEPVTITGLSWNRVIYVEQNTKFREQAWESFVPIDAIIISKESKIYDYKKVVDHYKTETYKESYQVKVGTTRVHVGTTNLGNGMFANKYENRPVYETRYRTKTRDVPVYREEPIYRNYVTYDIWRWVETRHCESSGTQDTVPQWPESVLGSFERFGRRTEAYVIYLRREQDKDPVNVTYSTSNYGEFNQWKVGMRAIANMYWSGSVSKLEKFGDVEESDFSERKKGSKELDV